MINENVVSIDINKKVSTSNESLRYDKLVLSPGIFSYSNIEGIMDTSNLDNKLYLQHGKPVQKQSFLRKV